VAAVLCSEINFTWFQEFVCLSRLESHFLCGLFCAVKFERRFQLLYEFFLFGNLLCAVCG
jgi:hypothetical protein